MGQYLLCYRLGPGSRNREQDEAMGTKKGDKHAAKKASAAPSRRQPTGRRQEASIPRVHIGESGRRLIEKLVRRLAAVHGVDVPTEAGESTDDDNDSNEATLDESTPAEVPSGSTVEIQANGDRSDGPSVPVQESELADVTVQVHMRQHAATYATCSDMHMWYMTLGNAA